MAVWARQGVKTKIGLDLHFDLQLNSSVSQLLKSNSAGSGAAQKFIVKQIEVSL